MPDFNKVILMGRLCAAPELKKTQSGISVTTFRLAINRRVGKESEPKTDFVDVVAWRGTAEFVCKYFTKGQPILVCGSLQSRNWQDKDGNKRVSLEVVADEVEFTESRGSGNNESSNMSSNSNTGTEKYDEIPTDEDYPF